MNKCWTLQYIPVYYTGTRLISKNTIHHTIIIGLEIAATVLSSGFWKLPCLYQLLHRYRTLDKTIDRVGKCIRGDNYSSIFDTWEFIFIVLYRTSKNLRMIFIVGIPYTVPYNVKMIISKCTSRALINQLFSNLTNPLARSRPRKL